MYARFSAFVGILMVTAPTLAADAVSFQQWTGAGQASTLPDDSVLTEYVAKTESESAVGAELRVSFSPRFSCLPMVSFLLPSDLLDPFESVVQQLTVDVDELSQEFPVLVDTEGPLTRYSLNGDSGEQQIWRAALDEGDLLTLNWPNDYSSEASDAGVEVDAKPTNPDTEKALMFSLLGSRLTILELENQCKTHNPIPYDN